MLISTDESSSEVRTTARPNGSHGSRWLCATILTVSLGLLGASAAVPWFRNEIARHRVRELGGMGVTRQPPIWLQKMAGERFARAACNSLVHVDLMMTETDDDDLRILGNASDLEYLEVSFTHVTDAGMMHVAKMPRLKSLCLNVPRMTDQGLSALSRLSELQHLCLQHTRITDRGLETLSSLPRLQSLHLYSSRISVGAPRVLARIAGLRELAVPGEILNDENILELRRLKHLEMLRIDGSTTLSLTAAESLKEHIPGLSIYW